MGGAKARREWQRGFSKIGPTAATINLPLSAKGAIRRLNGRRDDKAIVEGNGLIWVGTTYLPHSLQLTLGRSDRMSNLSGIILSLVMHPLPWHHIAQVKTLQELRTNQHMAHYLQSSQGICGRGTLIHASGHHSCLSASR